MNIDLSHFTPYASFAGGILIGIAAAILILFNGRIAGVSGILGQALNGGIVRDNLWRIAFVMGIIAAPALWQIWVGEIEISIETNALWLIIAGLFVGVGTSYGSGCTSGHGICGLSRFSMRSVIATLSFMLTGMVTVYMMRHILGA
ncbi:MAG: hypothetical protein RIR20_102 [Pseudomonadota bacterium]|jgi:uncharacterized membrane protein YedE/YeeE